MQLLVKNMVCNRCIKVVHEEIEKLGLHIVSIELGLVEISENPDKILFDKIQNMLEQNGFELLEDHHLAIVENIKCLIINEIRWEKRQKPESQNFSDFLVKQLGYEYSYLSNLFSSIEKITIEKYIIAQKIERTKELLFDNELSLSQIAWQLDYSSVAYLSNQFKQVTGIMPSDFKRQNTLKRLPLDKVNQEQPIIL